MKRIQYNDMGQEIPDPTKPALPTGFKRPDPLADRVRQMVHGELSRRARDQGFETFEESEDFDVGDPDDFDPTTPYEMEFDPLLGEEISPAQLRASDEPGRENADEQFRRRYMRKASKSSGAVDFIRSRLGWPFSKDQSDLEEAVGARERGSPRSAPRKRAPDDDE